jgi:hypothetical protein
VRITEYKPGHFLAAASAAIFSPSRKKRTHMARVPVRERSLRADFDEITPAGNTRHWVLNFSLEFSKSNISRFSNLWA